ncbi:MAG: ThuA domain-containing protein [Pirellulaceae bacterium]
MRSLWRMKATANVWTSRLFVGCLLCSLLCGSAQADPKWNALIIDGQNNHAVWPQTTQMMKKYLEETGQFTVEIATTAKQGTDPEFRPDFRRYHVVVSNYNGAAWPEATQRAFEQYVTDGGGFVVVHAANNAFSNWAAYNEIIGLGGWGGRTERHGPYVFVDAQGKVVRDTSPGRGGHHGPQHPFTLIVRDDQHPVTRGMPREWLHANDELYDLLRGPATGIQILATAYADPAQGGSGRHEPMIFTVQYGKGRVLHTPLGHGVDSQECVGFITTLQRGAEWAASGNVTQSIPADFPTAESVRRRPVATAP